MTLSALLSLGGAAADGLDVLFRCSKATLDSQLRGSSYQLFHRVGVGSVGQPPEECSAGTSGPRRGHQPGGVTSRVS